MSQQYDILSIPNGAQISGTDSVVATREWEGGSTPSRCVIETVAAVTDSDPCRITPLANAIDPDALDTVFGAGPDRSNCPAADQVSFEYEGFGVTVYAAQRLVLWELDNGPE